MKKLLTTALLGLASIALIATDANAQSPIVSNVGDVILGFDATGQIGTGAGTGSNLNLEVDLGNVSRFYNATPGQVINLNGTNGLALADIINTYGAGWAGNTDLRWGVVTTDGALGTADGHATADAMWVTRPEITPGVMQTPWNRSSVFAQRPPVSKIETIMVNGSPGTISGKTSTANSSVSGVISTALAGSWHSEDYFNIGASYGYFNPSVDNNVTPTDSNFTTFADFYELQVGSGPGTLLGKFELTTTGPNAGLFQFVAVPEPSSIGLMGVGFVSLIGMVVLRRRRSAMA